LKKLKPYKCRVCKNEFQRSRTTQVVCSLECSKIYAREKEEKKRKTEEKKEKKAWNKRKKEMRVDSHSSSNKIELQKAINKLSKLIDLRFHTTCIDCDKPFGNQIDASHFHNVGGGENLRYNLDNLHASKSDCNQFHGGRKSEYYDALIKRYGQEYADYVKFELPKKYDYIGLSNKEIAEKLALVRKIIRTFNTYVLEDPIKGRRIFNKLIGIYK